MTDLSAFPITRKWPAAHPDRLQLYSLPTPNGVKVSIMLEETKLPYEVHLVSFDTHRYSVPFSLIGQTVEVEAPDDQVRIFHRGTLVATHPRLLGHHQFHILPEHGPGALQRNQRRQRPSPFAGGAGHAAFPDVEIRDLALYDALALHPAQEIPA